MRILPRCVCAFNRNAHIHEKWYCKKRSWTRKVSVSLFVHTQKYCCGLVAFLIQCFWFAFLLLTLVSIQVGLQCLQEYHPTLDSQSQWCVSDTWGEAIEEEAIEEERMIREQGVAFRPAPRLRNYGDVSNSDRQSMVARINTMLPAASTTATTPTARDTRGTTSSIENVFGVGSCCVTGCTLFTQQLRHRCHKCQGLIHIMCAERHSNLLEDERYCNRCSPYKKWCTSLIIILFDRSGTSNEY